MQKRMSLSLLAMLFCLISQPLHATELTVMISGGFKAAWEKLAPEFAEKQGITLKTVPGPSMGKSAEAIPNRLAAGENADVIIMVGDALSDLSRNGMVIADTRTELANSRIGVVVSSGKPKPDISTDKTLRSALLEADSIAYSDSASGRYVQQQLFKKLGIEQQVQGKAHQVEKTPVALTVAQGHYTIGLQQVSELLPVPGVSFVGKIPDNVQYVTRFAGAVAAKTEHAEEAKLLLRYLSSKQVQQTVRATGLDSVTTP